MAAVQQRRMKASRIEARQEWDDAARRRRLTARRRGASGGQVCG
jgi:hypothetical protein